MAQYSEVEFLKQVYEAGNAYYNKMKKCEIRRIYFNGREKQNTVYIDLSKRDFNMSGLLGVVSEDHSNPHLKGMSDCYDFVDFCYKIKYSKDPVWKEEMFQKLEKIFEELCEMKYTPW